MEKNKKKIIKKRTIIAISIFVVLILALMFSLIIQLSSDDTKSVSGDLNITADYLISNGNLQDDNEEEPTEESDIKNSFLDLPLWFWFLIILGFYYLSKKNIL